ncbi:hypothetical protein D623_10016451 [Myotis brandtii]|uniref:Uncharacterized protein n=1 Tax=Myotis brandtii TaxID=109478 RepID=S7MZI0_MYOBR|nr:hypothetical protein D623_10016451 [Myotis brandtii]
MWSVRTHRGLSRAAPGDGTDGTCPPPRGGGQFLVWFLPGPQPPSLIHCSVTRVTSSLSKVPFAQPSVTGQWAPNTQRLHQMQHGHPHGGARATAKDSSVGFAVQLLTFLRDGAHNPGMCPDGESNRDRLVPRWILNH